MFKSPIINVMISATIKAAKGLRRDFVEVEHFLVSPKGTREFVVNSSVIKIQI